MSSKIDRPTVVLLHGLARRKGSMARLGRRLEREGYETWSCTYPSRQMSIRDAAAQVRGWIERDLGDRPLVAVTHSLGGIVFRHLGGLRWQRAVMLAPPNQGSQLAAGLHELALFRWFYGPAGGDLAKPARWPAPPAPVLVIAGTRARAITNVVSWTVGLKLGARDHDGTVTRDETRLPEMDGFAEVDATHTWIMNDRKVVAMTIEYLATGRAPALNRSGR